MVVVAAIWAAAPACGDVLTLTDGAVLAGIVVKDVLQEGPRGAVRVIEFDTVDGRKLTLAGTRVE